MKFSNVFIILCDAGDNGFISSFLLLLQFNRQPSKGVEYLISNKLVENTPGSVADFLKHTSNLNKVYGITVILY